MGHHRVQELRRHVPDVYELVLERNDLAFEIGDCLALHNEAAAQSRPYSIASGQDEDSLRFVIRRMVGGVVSPHLCELRNGDSVKVNPPFGWFRPGACGENAPFVFIATGTGIAPFLSYLRTPQRPAPVRCLYGVRALHDVVERDWLASQCELGLAISREDSPGVHRGRVTELLSDLPETPDLHVYLCRLDTMIDEVSDWFENRGLHHTQIHREVFFHSA